MEMKLVILHINLVVAQPSGVVGGGREAFKQEFIVGLECLYEAELVFGGFDCCPRERIS